MTLLRHPAAAHPRQCTPHVCLHAPTAPPACCAVPGAAVPPRAQPRISPPTAGDSPPTPLVAVPVWAPLDFRATIQSP